MIGGYRDVVFSAGGVNYTFRWGTTALKTLEEQNGGVPAPKFLQKISTAPSVTDLVLVMFCGLALHHKLTMRQVETLVDDIGGPDGIVKIFNDAMPKGAASTPANPPKRRASGTGKKR